MQPDRVRPTALVVLLVVLLHATPAGAVKLSAKEDIWLDLHLLVQPWMQLRHDPAAAERSFGNDFYLRRLRLIAGGQLTRWVSFFVETDQPNWGKGGDWSKPGFFVQDAYVSFDVHQAFKVVAGLVLIPFVHNAAQGATSLHTLDYHSELVKYPTGSHIIWRDVGVVVRGLVARQRLDYRVGITRGVADGYEVIKADPANPASVAVKSRTRSVPRFSGRVAFNLFDAEDGFFLAGTYLGNKKVVSVGAAFDVQPGVWGESTAYYGFGGDLFVDLPLAKNRRLSGQVNVVTYGAKSNPERGLGLLFDLGVAFGRWEPVVALDWYRWNKATSFADQSLGLHAGLNWWMLGHNVNLKLDLGLLKPPGTTMSKPQTVGTLQTQLYF
jgi:hypothetical protein